MFKLQNIIEKNNLYMIKKKKNVNYMKNILGLVV